MRSKGWMAAAAVLLAVGVVAAKAVVVPTQDVKWTPGAIPQVSMAVVDGDPAKGASHFFLKYAAGFVTPSHHHSADHYVTLLGGNLTLTADGKETKLTPGSYFAFTGKAAHVGKCEGSEDCVMFVDSRGAWDVVPEKP
ncbi:MAG TPA: cupin domain-containing protein [Candidatus Polarisedimenticolaceae bacterium]|nr:cupin domain-containing protein [Candidatus Polarisedimenticolaceae bacterium]